MKHLTRGPSLMLGLALAIATMAPLPGLSASATPATKSAEPSIVNAMRDTAQGAVTLRKNPATGRVGFARADQDLLPGVAAEGRRGAIDKATRYLDRFAPAFGARANELTQTEVFADQAGWSITFAQSYKGVPVFGGEIKAHVDREGNLTAVNGFAAPGLSLSVLPKVSQSDASARALAAVKAKPSGYEDAPPASYTQGLEVRSAHLTIYRTGSPRGIDGTATLAWDIEVWNKSTIRERLFLDAATGKPLNRMSMITDALDRTLYEAQQRPATGYDKVWSEGDAFPGALTQDQQNEALGASESYWLFKNTFGFDSWDGAGGKMITINNDPRINCPNANWNGFSTNYCTGVTGDDTVAHEWGHAYTESTSGLIYQWQAGAMNEAYSDIWGEVVDMLNTRMNETGEPGSPGGQVLRTPGLCSEFTRSDVTMQITAPAAVAGPCTAVPASFGPLIDKTGVSGTAVVAVDGTGPTDDGDDTSTGNACLPITNTAEVTGKWAYVDRGLCTFATKIKNVEDAGAIGIVVGNAPGRPLTSMAGVSSIYGVMVSDTDGTKFKTAGAPVDFTIKAVDQPADATHRWLSGESDPAFGGAIRDMWNPNCYGDPGAVSDAEYVCGTEDQGGVHTNSGVVNRTFALMVDGLPGKVTPIGLDKAANLFWHTQTNYLTPTSYFPDLADGLEASCKDLQGTDINEVTLGNPSKADGSDGAVTAQVISGGMTAADCTALGTAIAETQLRMDPTAECKWEPLIKPGAPKLLCGDATSTVTTFSEDFEDGLTGWPQDDQIAFPEIGKSIPWEATTKAPGDHPGGVAFGADPVAGNCGAPGDLTSRNGLISPAITVPSGQTPRMQFDHYAATESTWDGGNVKVSVNGGAFKLVPNDAYLFNAPGGELDPDSGVMAGQPAWTGTDGGQLRGSWGTTVVDLSKVAKAGDTVNFRFDMARDGCNGVDGWYIDNVVVEVCADATTSVTAVRAPEPTTFGESSKVDVTVTNPEGRVATGTVDLLKADGSKLSSGTLVDGRVSLLLPADLPVGTHALTAAYLGDSHLKASSAPVTVTVKPAATTPTATPTPTPTTPAPASVKSTTVVKLKKSRVKRGQGAKAIVSVSASKAVAGGQVKLRIGKYSKKVAVLASGNHVVFKISPKLTRKIKLGGVRIKAVYLGTTEVDRSVGKALLRVVR